MFRASAVLVAALALSALLSACGGSPPPYVDPVDPVAAVLPSTTHLAVEELPAPVPSPAARADGSEPVLGADSVAVMTENIHFLLDLMNDVANTGPRAEVSDQRTDYGPVPVCFAPLPGGCAEGAMLPLLLSIVRRPHSEFGVVLRVIDGEAEGEGDLVYRSFAAGYIERAGAEGAGRGRFVMNFGNLPPIPAYPEGFIFRFGFDDAGGAMSIVGSTSSSSNVSFSSYRAPDGSGTACIRLLAPVVDGPGGDELVFTHLGTKPDAGRKSYTVVSNWTEDAWNTFGDVAFEDEPFDRYLLTRSCNAPASAEPAFAETFLCPRSEAPAECAAARPGTVTAGVGSWDTTCAFAGDGEEMTPPAYAPTNLEANLPHLGGRVAPPEPPGFVSPEVDRILGDE